MKWKVKVAFLSLLLLASFTIRLFFCFKLFISFFFDSASKNENGTWKKSEPHIPKKKEQTQVFKGALYFMLLFLRFCATTH